MQRMQDTTNTFNDKSCVHPGTHGGGALWEQGLQHQRNDHAFGSGQTARTEPPPRKESTRARPPCCDEYRIAPLQSGLLVCKRAGRRVHRIPIGGTCIGDVLAIALGALLIGYKLRQQRLHRGRQVVGVGLGLRHQGFGDREVDGAFSSLRSACLHFENPKQRNAQIMRIEFETCQFRSLGCTHGLKSYPFVIGAWSENLSPL